MQKRQNSEIHTEFILSRPMVLLMAASSGIAVANLYYIQPLLAELAKAFRASQVTVGVAAMLIQIGYAIGLFLIVPLGDMRERRSLIVFMLSSACAALLLISFSFSIWMLLFAAFFLGITSIVPQLILPFAAHLAAPRERGKVIGAVMSGLLIGILLSRTFSGMVGSALGWRSVFRIAAGMMLLLIVILRVQLPKGLPSAQIRYGQLLKSMGSLWRSQPVLREASVNGAMMFATFSAFWTTLVFLLESPAYRLGAQAAGLFGLVGVSGALAASVVGRVADEKSPRFAVGVAIGLATVSYLCFWIWGYKLWGLVAGVILLDLGTQAGQVSNQARIHALDAEARNRINAVFMVSYFIGGAAGSFLGSLSWGLFRWQGVCIAGLLFQIIAVINHLVTGKAAGHR